MTFRLSLNNAVTPLQTIEQLSPEQISMIDCSTDDLAGIVVREAMGYRWLLNGGHSVQTMMSVASPSRLLLPNHVAMMFGLVFVAEAENILSLGMGGGSLERYLGKRYPQCKILSVESSNDVIRFAQMYFGLPENVQVVSSRAEDFILKTDYRFNFILCDIFENEKHPACLKTESFYRGMKSILRSEGVVSLNVTPESDRELIDILGVVRAVFSVVFVSAVRDHGNVIIVAKAGDVSPPETIQSRAESLCASFGISADQWLTDFKEIPGRGDSTV